MGWPNLVCIVTSGIGEFPRSAFVAPSATGFGSSPICLTCSLPRSAGGYGFDVPPSAGGGCEEASAIEWSACDGRRVRVGHLLVLSVPLSAHPSSRANRDARRGPVVGAPPDRGA